jgi:hypothetical protein
MEIDPAVLSAVKNEVPKTVTPSAVFLSVASFSAILADLRRPAFSKSMIGGIDNGSAWFCCCAFAAGKAGDWPADVPSFSFTRLVDDELAAVFVSWSNETLFEDGSDDFPFLSLGRLHLLIVLGRGCLSWA